MINLDEIAMNQIHYDTVQIREKYYNNYIDLYDYTHSGKYNVAVVLGSIVYKTNTGWEIVIHKKDTNTLAEKHIHIGKGSYKYSQNDDGSSHDGSKGSPPNSVKKYALQRFISFI